MSSTITTTATTKIGATKVDKMTTTSTSTTTTTTTSTTEEKVEQSTFLVLGGTGFIGRNLVEYLCTNKLASSILVADKTMPIIAYLNSVHLEFYNSDIVTFKQIDLALSSSVEAFFKDKKFDYVINLCGETRFGLAELDYEVRSYKPAQNTSKAAQASGVKKFIEISSGQIYKPDKNSSTEDSIHEPWTMQGKYRLQAEKAIQDVDGLPYVILRPAICYGPGDLTGLSPRLTCAAVYKETKKKLQFLWTKSLAMNVVHVRDLCEAIWIACSELEPGTIYNVAEPSNVTQGDLNKVLGDIFDIETGFRGTAISTLAKTNLKGIADMANDEHVPEWTKMCEAVGIYNTPLTPYIDKELLYSNNLKINGEKITKDSTFTYKVKFSKESVKEQLVSFIDQKIFPPTDLK